MVCLLSNDLPNQCVVLQDSRNQVTSQHFPSSHSKCFLKQSLSHSFIQALFSMLFSCKCVLSSIHTLLHSDACFGEKLFLVLIHLHICVLLFLYYSGITKKWPTHLFLVLFYSFLSFEMNIFPSKHI